MIIKIERHIKDTPEWEKNWILVDKINRIDKHECSFDPGYLLKSESKSNLVIKDHRKQNDYIKLICILENGELYKIDFDTVAYIQNDNGKTIEKIRVYDYADFDVEEDNDDDNNDNDDNDDDDNDDDDNDDDELQLDPICDICNFYNDQHINLCKICEGYSEFKTTNKQKACIICKHNSNSTGSKSTCKYCDINASLFKFKNN